MRKIHRELTKTEYKMLTHMSYQEQHDWLFPDGVPQIWQCGYGYYGHELVKRDNGYFAVFSIGESCD